MGVVSYMERDVPAHYHSPVLALVLRMGMVFESYTYDYHDQEDRVCYKYRPVKGKSMHCLLVVNKSLEWRYWEMGHTGWRRIPTLPDEASLQVFLADTLAGQLLFQYKLNVLAHLVSTP